MRGENQEQPLHPIYNYAFITDAVEGLIVDQRQTRCRTGSRATTSSRAR